MYFGSEYIKSFPKGNPEINHAVHTGISQIFE